MTSLLPCRNRTAGAGCRSDAPGAGKNHPSTATPSSASIQTSRAPGGTGRSTGSSTLIGHTTWRCQRQATSVSSA